MKKVFFLLTVFVFSLALVQAQSLDNILNNYFKATGTAKLAAAKTIVVKGKISQMNMDLPMVIKVKRPKKFRMEMEMQGQKMISAFDGEQGWMIAPWISPDPQDLTGEQLEQSKEQADMEGDLYNYAEKGHKAEYMGKEDMEGTEVYKIKLDKKNGDVQYYYIDTDSNMLLKVTTITKRTGNEVQVETSMGNYKMIDGIAMPMSIESKVPGLNQSSQIVIDTVELNVDLPDSLFVKPVK